VIRYALGEKADQTGRTIHETVGDVARDNVGLIGLSHGGNTCGVVMGMHGEALPDLAFYISHESPYGEGNVGVELGGRHTGRVNPAYDPDTGTLDLSKLDYGPELAVPSPRRPPRWDDNYTILRGSLFFDVDNDSQFNADKDFQPMPFQCDLGDGRKIWYSCRLLREAESRGLWAGARSAHIPSVEEAAEFWRYRDGAPHVADAVRKIPQLAVLVVARQTDHVQLAPDHPHVLRQVNAFQEAGAKLIRLNPDRAYVEWVTGRTDEALVDNDANQTYDAERIAGALEPDRAAPTGALLAAAACELADRVQAGNFEPNLGSVLFPDAPRALVGPPAGRRPPRRRPGPREPEALETRRHRKVEVDAASVTGAIRSLQGVNVGPAHTRQDVPDVMRQYRDLRIDSVRTHDFYGPTDLDAWRPGEPWNAIIFPDSDADPGREQSYHFGPSDRLIQAIIDSGAEVYYRLGRSWGAAAEPPADFEHFAEICRHVVMHYNDGWSDGHRHGIRYWEVWNEPNGRKFWTGTPDQFHALYEAVARTLKAYDPQLRVGACGLAGGRQEGAYREGLIRYCANHDVPLDFYSWHTYFGGSRDPYDLARTAETVRGLLDAEGFAKAEVHVTEWNYDLGRHGLHNQVSMAAAAFTGCALIYLQDAPVKRSHYYRGDAGHGMGLFERDGSYRKKAYAFKAMGRMLDTPQRLEATGGDTRGFAVLAGRSAEGDRVQVLVSNYEIRPEADPRGPGFGRDSAPAARREVTYAYDDNGGYDLTVKNLPWGEGRFTVERYRLTGRDDFALVETSTAEGGTVTFSHDLPSPGLALIVLKRQ